MAGDIRAALAYVSLLSVLPYSFSLPLFIYIYIYMSSLPLILLFGIY